MNCILGAMAKKTESTPRGSGKKQPASFEKALSELQDIVRELESGEQSLDDSLKLYERGIASLRTCHALLDQAEQRIRKLVADCGGNVTEEPFETEYNGRNTRLTRRYRLRTNPSHAGHFR